MRWLQRIGLGLRSNVGLGGSGLALKEGIELNLLWLVVGIDFQPFALKLPGLGRLGLK